MANRKPVPYARILFTMLNCDDVTVLRHRPCDTVLLHTYELHELLCCASIFLLSYDTQQKATETRIEGLSGFFPIEFKTEMKYSLLESNWLGKAWNCLSLRNHLIIIHSFSHEHRNVPTRLLADSPIRQREFWPLRHKHQADKSI